MLKRSTQSASAVGATPDFTQYHVTIFTSAFQARGELRAPGILQTFLNDMQRPTVTVFSADVISSDANNPIARMSIPEWVVRKQQLQIMCFDVRPPEESMKLMPRGERLAVYTDRYILDGEFHMGADSRISDFADTAIQLFLIAVNVRVYPLSHPRTALLQSSPMAVIHKNVIESLHTVSG